MFPGIEVTCSDNARCLAIFDPAAGPTVLSHFLGKLRDITVAPANDSKTHPVANANITVADLFHEVSTDAVLRDICVLLPHFSDGAAHKHLNEEGHHGRFAKLLCDGVYIEKRFTELERSPSRRSTARYRSGATDARPS